MGKIEYSIDDVVRVQKVGGSSMELHGKFAGDVLAEIKEMSSVDLSRAGTGHYVLQVTGGIVKPKDENQSELNLKVDKSRIPPDPINYNYNLAPSPEQQKEFNLLLEGQIIEGAKYNEVTGLYDLILCANPKAKKPSRWKMSFVNATMTEIMPEKKKKKTDATAPGDADNDINACLYDALMQGGRQEDRWKYLHESGADNEHITTHLIEMFGKAKNVKAAVLRGVKCEITGGRSPAFEWMVDDADKKMKVSGSALLKMVRKVMNVGPEKKKDDK